MQNFVRVVETGSISAAAESMGIVKSAVSKRLSELEKTLGVELMHRSTRKLTLTHTGAGYYERCVQILAEIEELNDSVRGDDRDLHGRIRVTAPLSFGRRHLQQPIIDFAHRHPGLHFDLILSDRSLDLIQEGIDLAFRIGDLKDSSLIAKRLAPIRQVVCASRDYFAEHGIPSTPQELQRHRCLVYSNLNEPAVWRYRDFDNQLNKVEVKPVMTADSGDFLLQAAIAGLGIIMEPNFIVHEAVAQQTLIPVLTEYRWMESNLYAVYPPTRHLSKRVRGFIDFIASGLDRTPYWDAPIDEFVARST